MSAITETSGLTAAARIDLVLSDRWVAYPQGQTALQRLEELLRGAQRTRMPSLLIVGDPDMGKTTILRKFMRGRAPTFDAETGRSQMEVVAIEAPPEADELRLYGIILDAVGAPTPTRRAMEAERAVHGQLERLRTRLLVSAVRWQGWRPSSEQSAPGSKVQPPFSCALGSPVRQPCGPGCGRPASSVSSWLFHLRCAGGRILYQECGSHACCAGR